MRDVTRIEKERRYRRQPRTEDEMAAYIVAGQLRFDYANRLCELRLRTCTKQATAVHHVFPQRMGRDDSLLNLRACCASCNEAVERMGRRTAERLGWFSPTPLGQTNE
jgi:5-methylcytosine-specific restriction endonuclease McrA